MTKKQHILVDCMDPIGIWSNAPYGNITRIQGKDISSPSLIQNHGRVSISFSVSFSCLLCFSLCSTGWLKNVIYVEPGRVLLPDTVPFHLVAYPYHLDLSIQVILKVRGAS